MFGDSTSSPAPFGRFQAKATPTSSNKTQAQANGRIFVHKKKKFVRLATPPPYSPEELLVAVVKERPAIKDAKGEGAEESSP